MYLRRPAPLGDKAVIRSILDLRCAGNKLEQVIGVHEGPQCGLQGTLEGCKKVVGFHEGSQCISDPPPWVTKQSVQWDPS